MAGVGLTWYTWFEQGRDIRVSPDFLENVSRALRLSGAERRHLFVLLNQDTAPASVPERKVSPALQRMLDGMPGRPAYIRTARWDVIAWNKAAARLFGFHRRRPEERNLVARDVHRSRVPRHGAELVGCRADHAGEVPQRLCPLSRRSADGCAGQRDAAALAGIPPASGGATT